MPGGVRAGLGENFDPDPTVIRLVRVAVMLLSLGIGLIVCLIAWIVVPENPASRRQPCWSQDPVGRTNISSGIRINSSGRNS